MPGCSASRPAPTPCSTSMYKLHREGVQPSEHSVAVMASQEDKDMGPLGVGDDGDGKAAGGGTDEDDVHRALTQEQMIIRWHQRFGHMSFTAIARLIGLGAEGLKNLNKSAALRLVDREDRCDACAVSNLKEASLKASSSRASSRGDLAHCDLSGPYTGNVDDEGLATMGSPSTNIHRFQDQDAAYRQRNGVRQRRDGLMGRR
ncbi:unnamed protein product [Tilletia caries]|nr:unnamed protein product [Tilletia caries]